MPRSRRRLWLELAAVIVLMAFGGYCNTVPPVYSTANTTRSPDAVITCVLLSGGFDMTTPNNWQLRPDCPKGHGDQRQRVTAEELRHGLDGGSLQFWCAVCREYWKPSEIEQAFLQRELDAGTVSTVPRA